ncbi:MAG: formimidoylglutamase [Aquaticitalea sp.]
MDKLILFNTSDLKSLLKNRTNESKFGEHVQLVTDFNNIYDSFITLDVDYVIFGIKEDIGVFANYGNIGTAKAWDATLKILLNIQSNAFTNPNKVLILGHLDFESDMEKVSSYNQANEKDIKKARKKVAKIDTYVTSLVHEIVKAGKIPIVIGGGHNNSYGNIKGTSLALKKQINVINFDAHSDFRPEEGRHSGNGFSYAYGEGFLKNYFIFGLHENYTPDIIFRRLNKFKNIKFNTFEAISIRNENTFKSELEHASEFISQRPFGIEVDCDAIKNIPSSAMTPSGYSVKKARAFVNHFGSLKKAKYLHICEASPTPDTEIKVGKLITYLITDFMRAKNSLYEKTE